MFENTCWSFPFSCVPWFPRAKCLQRIEDTSWELAAGLCLCWRPAKQPALRGGWRLHLPSTISRLLWQVVPREQILLCCPGLQKAGIGGERKPSQAYRDVRGWMQRLYPAKRGWHLPAPAPLPCSGGICSLLVCTVLLGALFAFSAGPDFEDSALPNKMSCSCLLSSSSVLSLLPSIHSPSQRFIPLILHSAFSIIVCF